MPLLLRLPQKAAGRAVVIAEHFRVLEKFTPLHHPLKFCARNKVILFTVLFAPARKTGSVGDREIKVGNQLEEFRNQRGFTRARRRRDDVDKWFAACRSHSRFCTCSRDFSISAFITSPASVIFKASPANPDVFESSVLASRFISCSRKSSFLPTSPPSSSNPRKCFTWVSSRTSSSWMSLRSTSSAASCSRRSGST